MSLSGPESLPPVTPSRIEFEHGTRPFPVEQSIRIHDPEVHQERIPPTLDIDLGYVYVAERGGADRTEPD